MGAILSYFPSLWGKKIWKMSLLVICEILGLFVNTLTVDDKYPLLNFPNLPKKLFSNFFGLFLESPSNCKHFEKIMIVITYVFRNLQTVKDLVRPLSRKRPFRTPFDSQHVEGFQTLVKSSWKQFYHILLLLWETLIWKISLFVIYEILAVFVKILTDDDKYNLRNRVKLRLPIQAQLPR